GRRRRAARARRRLRQELRALRAAVLHRDAARPPRRGAGADGGSVAMTAWRLCSSCKKPIGLGATYWACSVSTCNRARLARYFGSGACWDAHLPEARHREAWAEEKRAPTVPDSSEEPRRVVVAPVTAAAPVEREVLVVVSKLKTYIKARSGMNTSD